MELELWIVVVLSLVYFFAGFIDSIAGGGGLISLPFFLLTGIPADNIMGTSKLATCLGTSASIVNYALKGLVLWKLAIVGLPAAMLGGFLGSELILLFDSATIGKIMIFLLPLGIAATLFPRKKRQEEELTPRKIYIYNPLICGAIGFYEGFFGPGTGSFFILAFHFLLGIGLVQASASAKVFNLAASLCALFIFCLHGKVLYLLALPLAAANILGNIIGTRLAIRIGAVFIRRILIFSLSILFATLIVKFIL